MRPKSIVNFERLVLLGIVLGIINSLLVADQMDALIAQAGGGTAPSTIYTIQAIMILLYLLLVWFISRKGSPIAKWIYVVLAALGLIFGLTSINQLMEFGTLPLIVSVLSYVITAVTIYLLFRPDAKAWFNEGRGGDADADAFR
jgi:predicted membrane channel-forming protein YqfA (hemolysin III family)